MSAGARPRAVTGNLDRYELGDAVPIEGLETVTAGTSLLVSGPSMTGKATLATAVMAEGLARGEYGVMIAADDTADRLRREDRLGDHPRLHTVDCSGTADRGSFDDTERAKYVSSPGDLTGIGIGVAKSTQTIGAGASEGVRLGVLSLSTVLRSAHVERVFSFLHLLTGRVAAAGYLGVATFDPTAHEASAANTITGQFDGVIELDENDDGRRIRARGLPEVDRGWRPC